MFFSTLLWDICLAEFWRKAVPHGSLLGLILATLGGLGGKAKTVHPPRRELDFQGLELKFWATNRAIMRM